MSITYFSTVSRNIFNIFPPLLRNRSINYASLVKNISQFHNENVHEKLSHSQLTFGRFHFTQFSILLTETRSRSDTFVGIPSISFLPPFPETSPSIKQQTAAKYARRIKCWYFLLSGRFNIREVRDRWDRVGLQQPWTLHVLGRAPLKYRIYIHHVSRVVHFRAFWDGRKGSGMQIFYLQIQNNTKTQTENQMKSNSWIKKNKKTNSNKTFFLYSISKTADCSWTTVAVDFSLDWHLIHKIVCFHNNVQNYFKEILTTTN